MDVLRRVFVGVGVAVGMAVGVAVEVGVVVGVSVAVGEGVTVGVLVGTDVDVGLGVDVTLHCPALHDAAAGAARSEGVMLHVVTRATTSRRPHRLGLLILSPLRLQPLA
jgi:hypothetical protein